MFILVDPCRGLVRVLRIHSFLPYNSPGAGAGAVLFLKGRSRSRRKQGGSAALDYKNSGLTVYKKCCQDVYYYQIPPKHKIRDIHLSHLRLQLVMTTRLISWFYLRQTISELWLARVISELWLTKLNFKLWLIRLISDLWLIRLISKLWLTR